MRLVLPSSQYFESKMTFRDDQTSMKNPNPHYSQQLQLTLPSKPSFNDKTKLSSFNVTKPAPAVKIDLLDF